MDTREDIEEALNAFAGPDRGVQQQVVASIITVKLLLDIRDLLINRG